MFEENILQLILGIILLALGAISMGFGGHFLSEGWKKIRWKLNLGIILLALGAISMGFGGHFLSDGWKKFDSSAPNALKIQVPEEKEDVFRINITSLMSFKFPSPLLYFYNSKFGKTISPISIAFYTEVINNKNIISRIYSYSVRARFRYDEGGEFIVIEDDKGDRSFKYEPSGNIVEKWQSIHSLGMLHDQVYWVNDNDWTKCKRLDFSKNSFDLQSREKQLQPGESISGWMFFEIPTVLRGQLLEILEIELIVKNSIGEIQTTRIEYSKLDTIYSSISSGAWHFLEGYYDLTKANYTLLPRIDLQEIFKEEKLKAKRNK